MSTAARPSSVKTSDFTLEMKVANMTFMLERLAQTPRRYNSCES